MILNIAFLKPKLAKVFDDVVKKHKRFYNNTLGLWSMWSYEKNIPKEVSQAAEKLGVPFGQIEFFTNRDDKQAFNDFAIAIQKEKFKYEFGTYKSQIGIPINFAVVVNE